MTKGIAKKPNRRGQQVWLAPTAGGNKTRLVDARQVDVTELVNHTIRVTLQKQLEEVIGKVILSDSEGNQLPLSDGLLSLDGANVLGKVRLVTTAGDEITDDEADAVKISESLLTKVAHPFAKGSLTTTGAQYCTAVSSIDNDAYDGIDAQTIQQPSGYTLYEIEFGLTGRLDVSGTPTDNALWKWQASDDGVDWEDLIAEQTLTTPSAATDVSCSGRFAPTGNFLGTSSSFQVRFVAKCSGATDTVTAETKNSSYILCRYRRE